VPPPTHPGLSIAAVGDTMPGTDFPENILPDDDGLSFLDAVTPILSQSDVTFGNFEGVLLDGGEPVKQCKNTKICFLFRTPTRYATYLKLAGFDAMSLANNHARDFGEEGRSSSMAALDAAGIHHSGREGTTASWIANGRRVALAAFAPNVGSNQLNEPEVARALVEQLAATHDIVIVSFHGGAEGTGAEVLPFAREIFAGEDRGNVVEFAHAMIDAGADLVLGHGPHVVRPMELYHDRLIAYSLGNFATYYGISVEGIRGIAPILLAELDDDGRFVSGRIEPTIQIRPAGPAPDPNRGVITLLQGLTATAFPGGDLAIADDGALSRRAR
jgi:poly-gamma-glutamate capsule biosynthesis protein CapA/YwtB (metallophosphatase superfamily)